MTIPVTASHSSAEETFTLLNRVQELARPWLESADRDVSEVSDRKSSAGPPILVDQYEPSQLAELLKLELNDSTGGVEDLVSVVRNVLQYSVNTSSPGFMDKLYAAPSPAGLAADHLLSILNTNSHVYTVSPALTLIEKHVGKDLANLFGLKEDVSGGVTVPGGAMANTMALLVARNVRFPQVITDGLRSLPKPLAIFTSEASHYSMSTAAQTIGLGSKSVRKVAVVEDMMDVDALREEIEKSIEEGFVPFYIGATAGTTVRGAYDDLRKIAAIAQEYGAWFHVDACWGGGAIWSPKLAYKLDGSELADSISYNPHKMIGVPLTCSFLLGRDLRTFWAANRLEAGYLFHGDAELIPSSATTTETPDVSSKETVDSSNGWRQNASITNAPHPDKVFDLAQFTTQCGRRPDALKMYLHWRYYGTAGIAKHVETAFEGAKRVLSLVEKSNLLASVEKGDPPCAQACFYYSGTQGHLRPEKRITREIVERLVNAGWMTDYAPGAIKTEEYLRVVCNRLTTDSVAENLVSAIELIGKQVELDWNL